MAASTRSRTTITQSLLGSEDEVSGLHGPVPIGTSNSLARMARYLGLQTPQVVSNWLRSIAFLPYFQELYDACIKPNQDLAAASNHPRKQGPQLSAVQNAIANGEKYGDQKYSGYYVDKSEFEEIDHYALCLFRLCRANTDGRDGVFRNKPMTEAEKEVRLWCAMLRATYDRATSRQQRQRNQSEDSPSSPASPGSSSEVESLVSPNKRPRLSLQNSKSIHQLTDSENPRNQLIGLQMRKSSAESNMSPTTNQTPSHNNRSDNEDAEGDGDNRNMDAGGPPAASETRTMDDFDRMKVVRNVDRPFDLLTHYGRYLTIHHVVKHFKDEFEIQRLFVTKALPVEDSTQALNHESRLWHDELEATAKEQRFTMRAATEDEASQQDAMEKFFDNPKFQRFDYITACHDLHITDPERPRFLGMPTTMVLRSWQVTGIKALIDFEKDPAIRAAILADATGLGKTLEIIGYWYRRLLVFEAQRRSSTSANQPSAKPLLVILPPELIPQWAAEIRRFSDKFRPVLYYGDKRSSLKSATPKVDGLLTKSSPYFGGEAKNGYIVIITSLSTLVARHGPPALRAYRINKKGWSANAATQATHDPDVDWPHDLSGVFDIVTIDEAHQIKNPDTAAHTTVAWLQASFHVLATASVLPNSIGDFEGYMHFIDMNRNLWQDENLQEWEVDKSVNPFELEDDHPAAVLRMTVQAVQTFITGDDANRNNAGFYLQKIWQRCLIRRTYASKDPMDIESGRAIGEALPRLQTRRIICRFDKADKEMYDKFSELPIRKLATFLDNGRLVWNRKHARQLILNSTWLGFHWIGDDVHAGTIKDWKAIPSILFCWIKLLHKKQHETLEGGAKFTIPDSGDVPQQLAILCQGSPKLRHALRILAELVVLIRHKVVIWYGLPANQLLLLACCQALQIECVCYTSELSHSERAELVSTFVNQPQSAYVFIGSFNVRSVGLNLQALCNHTIDFDSAPNKGIQDQATGRLRRLNQPYTVERFELSVEKSFQSRVIQDSLMKAVPGAIAELSMNVESSKGEDGETEFSVGEWYLLNHELVQAPDPRVAGLPADQKLTPAAVVQAIMDIQRGVREEADQHHVWEPEDLNGFDIEIELDGIIEQ